jgi:hypothetical protein
MADWTKVNIIDASVRDPATAYVGADRHRLDDFRPLAWRTHDFGRTWTQIGHGLPADAWVGVVRQDPVRPGLLYAGTSRGVHVSFDDGESWQSLQLGLPTTGINDLLVKNEDLIVATQGRGLWTLDAITPLRHLAAGSLERTPLMAPPAVAYRVPFSQNKDTPLPPEEPRAPNFPAGAVIDYFLPAAPRGPVSLEIADADGQVVRRFRSDEPPPKLPATPYFAELWRPDPPALTARAGHNRFVWDLRLPRPRTTEYEYSIAALPGRPTPLLPAGPYVLPGRYEVRLSVDSGTLRETLTVLQDPRRAETADELAALLAFERETIASLEAAADAAEETARLAARITALADNPQARRARSLVTQARRELEAVGGADGRELLTRLDRQLRALETDLESSDAPPTEGQRQLLADSRARLAPALERLAALRGGALARLDARLRALGVVEPRVLPPAKDAGGSEDAP